MSTCTATLCTDTAHDGQFCPWHKANQHHEAIKNAITLGAQESAPLPTETQNAYHAVIHLVVPDVGSEAAASDYIAETLRDQFLDWSYVRESDDDFNDTPLGEGELQTPIRIRVSKPYFEGTFLDGVES